MADTEQDVQTESNYSNVDLSAVSRALAQSQNLSPAPAAKPTFVNKYVLTPLGKTLDVLDTDLNAVTNILRPVFTGINPKLNEVYDRAPKKFGMPNVVPSDLIEESLANTPGNKILSKIMGFAADVALSPTTYMAGVGTLTKEGKLFAKIKGAENIALDSKLAKQIAAHYGENISPALIGKAKKAAKALGDTPSLAEQAKAGRLALINIGVPFTSIEVPFLRGQLFFRGVDKAGLYLKDNKALKAFNTLFSTSSGNPAFDEKRLAIQGLVNLRKSNVEEFSVWMGKNGEQAAKEYGMSRSEFAKMIIDQAENPYRGNISADALIATFTTDINNKIIEGIPVDRIIQSLPGVDSMVMSERAKLHDALLRSLKEQAAGYNVHTAAFLRLPNEVRNLFVNEYAKGAGVKFAQDVARNKSVQFADLAATVDAYNRGVKFKGVEIAPGVEAGLFALVGKKEYARLIKYEADFAKLSKTLAIPSGVGTEAAAMRDVVQRIVSTVDQGFATSYTLYKNAPEYLKNMYPRMYKLQELIDSKPEWKVKSLIEQFNIPVHLAKQYPKAFDLAQVYRNYMQTQLQLEQKAGVPISEFTGDISYIPHVPTEDARKLLVELYGDKYKGAVRDWNIDHLNTLAREFKIVDNRAVNLMHNTGQITSKQRKNIAKFGEDYIQYLVKEGKLAPDKANEMYHYLTVSEVNTLASQGKLKLLNGKKIDKFFEENPAQQILVRGIRGEKARTSADFYEAIRQFGQWHNVDEALPEGKMYLKNETANPLAAVQEKTIAGKTGKYALIFDEGIAKQVDMVHRSLNLPAGVHPILNIFDKLQNEWKMWTLSMFPAYHTRNFIGNLWNNYLAGIHTPEPYMKALDVQLGKKVFITTGAGQKLSGLQVVGLAQKHDILNMGQFWGDIEHYFKADVEDGIKSMATNVYEKGIKKVPKFGLRVGNHVQNNANLALFIRRLEEGYSAEKAAQEVRKFQFDYRNITPFERNVMRRVLPFYSWTRFNIPLQLEAAFTHPQRLLAVSKARNVLESNYDGVPDERLLPDYYVQNFPIRIRYDRGRKQYEYFLLNSWLPAADIDKIFDPVTFVKNNLTPFLKEPIQQIANRDFFTGQEIDKGDNYDVLNIFGKKITLPARQIHGLKNIRALSEIDRLSDPTLSPTSKAVKFATGKLYPLNEDKQRQINTFEYRDRKAKLKAELKKANINNNKGEADRVLKKLQQLSKERGEGG